MGAGFIAVTGVTERRISGSGWVGVDGAISPRKKRPQGGAAAELEVEAGRLGLQREAEAGGQIASKLLAFRPPAVRRCWAGGAADNLLLLAATSPRIKPVTTFTTARIAVAMARILALRMSVSLIPWEVGSQSFKKIRSSHRSKL